MFSQLSANERPTSASQESSSEEKQFPRIIPRIKISSFFDPGAKWVLVPGGNFGNHFSWVPEHLRIGPWSQAAWPTLFFLVSCLLHSFPMEDQFDTSVKYYPQAFTSLWYYNISMFFFMIGVVCRSISRSHVGILVAFTLLSWNLNALRHGLNALAPFLRDHHILLKVNHIIRFPALSSATMTFVVWNAVLVPYIYLFLLDTREKKDNFITWMTNFNLVQFHCCNIFYAVLNTMVTGIRATPALFDKEDLWYSLTYYVAYSLFYILVCDRIGIHIYPIFSPRSRYFLLAWGGGYFFAYGIFLFWNYFMSNYSSFLDFHYILCLDFIIIGLGLVIHQILTLVKNENMLHKKKAEADNE